MSKMSMMIRAEAAPRTLVKRSRACMNADVDKFWTHVRYTGWMSNDRGALRIRPNTLTTSAISHRPCLAFSSNCWVLGTSFRATTRAAVITKRGQLENLVGSTIGASQVTFNVSTLALRTWTFFLLSIVIVNWDVLWSCVSVDGRYDISTTGDEINYHSVRYRQCQWRDQNLTWFPRRVYRVP